MRSFLVFICGALLISGCEGYKTLSIHNRTKNAILITMRRKPDPWTTADVKEPVAPSTDTLRSGDTMRILSYFTYTIPRRLHAVELPIDYLRIETNHDTLVATDAQAIIDLQRGNRISVQ